MRLRRGSGGINLEDIAAPPCFEVERRRLSEAAGLPVFHDDQHGTAIVVLAALLKRHPSRSAVTVADCASPSPGIGAAGAACANILLDAGGSRHHRGGPRGVLHRAAATADPAEGRAGASTPTPTASPAASIEALEAHRPPPRRLGAGILTVELIATMAADAVVFALANLTRRSTRRRRRASTRPWSPPAAATSRTRSTTCSPFPGVFRGALDAGAGRILEAMKVAAAEAIFAKRRRRPRARTGSYRARYGSAGRPLVSTSGRSPTATGI